MSVILTIRAGVKDARTGWQEIAMLFAAALILAVVYQLIDLHRVYPGEAMLVAILLAVVPYLLGRGVVNRLFRCMQKEP